VGSRGRLRGGSGEKVRKKNVVPDIVFELRYLENGELRF
jgi:hypothetical protein